MCVHGCARACVCVRQTTYCDSAVSVCVWRVTVCQYVCVCVLGGGGGAAVACYSGSSN